MGGLWARNLKRQQKKVGTTAKTGMNYNENSFMYAVHLFGGSVFRLFWDPILFSLYVVFAPGSPVGGSASAENRVMMMLEDSDEIGIN